MKYVLRQNSRSASKAETKIALFPFLAVLICTMGALVPLLMAITYVARQQAQQAAAEKIAEHSEHIKTEIEDARWRIGQLQTIREANENELAQTRLELSHLEDHRRRLREKLEGLKAKLDQLERPDAAGALENSEVEVEIGQLRAEIDAARRKLDDAHRAAAERKPCYAIIPYEGPNQTRRRPIYIECRADAVILQPEGIELIESDFEGPLGPGNPLAAALRAVSEYIQSRPGYDYKSGEPYPMLLVRPDGVEAYYVARAAMTSWASDFGYELIGDDWQLAFPRPDPQLSETLRQVVAAARVRQERLAAAAPTHRGVSSKVVYRASPTGGGFIREQVADDSGSGSGNQGGGRGDRSGRGAWDDGRGGHGGGSRAGNSAYPSQNSANDLAGGGNSQNGSAFPSQHSASSQRPANAFAEGGGSGSGSGYPPGSSGNGINGGTYDGQYGATGGDGSQNGSAYPSQSSAATGNGGAGDGTGGAYGQSGNGNYVPSGAAGHYAENNPLRGVQSGQTGGSSYSEGTQSQGATGQRPDGYVIGRPPSEQDGTSGEGAEGQAILPGQWVPAPPRQSGPSFAGGSPGSDASGGQPGGPPGGQAGGGESSDGKPGAPGGGCQMSVNLADKRGKDWGLRDTGRGAVGLSRPISVDCHPDRIVFRPERGLGETKTIVLGPRLENSVDELVSAVWNRIETWGIAGQNMYWRPVLKVAVVPGAERRFDELKTVLDGSGVAVEKK